MKFDIEKYKKIHIIGIKGVGTAALSELLIKNGHMVTGSDIKEEFITDKPLKKAGIVVFEFGKKDLSGYDAVIRSVAYDIKNNEDVRMAESLGIPIFTYPEVVASIFNNKFGVAVAGSHGKTTITAMLSDILDKAGKNLNAIVGSKVNSWNSGAKTNNLKKDEAIFVLEADEYRGAFLNYFPKCAIIANIDYDHPDCYKTKEDYESTFLNFAKNISDDGFLIANNDYPEIKKISENLNCKIIFYNEKNIIHFKLKFPGVYNQLNANAAYLCALELGVSKEGAKKSLEEFSGTARRFDILGKKENAVIIDDYAHHPSEIKAALSGVKEMFPNKKVVAIFQPHTYSRTKKFSIDFSKAFDMANQVVLMDIFSSARESFDSSVSVKDISDKIGEKAIFIKDRKKILEFSKKYFSEDSVIIFMGAGDIWQLARDLYQDT
jgi:UDP-N-acetylmuramate--alanine ligase